MGHARRDAWVPLTADEAMLEPLLPGVVSQKEDAAAAKSDCADVAGCASQKDEVGLASQNDDVRLNWVELGWASQKDEVGLASQKDDARLDCVELGWASQNDEVGLASQNDDVGVDWVELGLVSQNDDAAVDCVELVLDWESQNDVVGLNESQSVDALEASLELGCESQNEDVLAGSAAFVLG